jgi:hypothetical protein
MINEGLHGPVLDESSTVLVLNDLAPTFYYHWLRDGSAVAGATTESSRTSLTTREPGAEGKCATEGGTVEAHSYDTASRLIDSGVSYETFGNTTTLPATDADGHELTSEYYVDNQIAAQKQSEETIKYLYDPAGRTMETASEGKTAAKTISHYAGPGEAITWTNEGSEKWSRNIPGIGGSLVATQKSGEQPILQLRDLQGNIIATAALSETEAKLLSTYNSTEFGVPQPGATAPPYSWLGALDISSGLPTSGTVTTGASSYVPEIGRPLQTEPTASPGAFPDGTGGAGVVYAPYLGADNNQLKVFAVEQAAEQEAAKRHEAEERAKENECGASECGPSEGNFPAPEEGGAEEYITLDPTFTTEFTHNNLNQTNTSQYGVLSIQVKYLGGGKARLQWSYELSPGLQGRISGVVTESASIYEIGGGKTGYSDYHRGMPMDYLFHSAPEVSTRINYQLAINLEIEGISSTTGRGVTAMLYVRCNFIIR